MRIESFLELVVFLWRMKPCPDSEMVRQLAAEVIIEMPACEAREEIVSHNAKLGRARKTAKSGTELGF